VNLSARKYHGELVPCAVCGQRHTLGLCKASLRGYSPEQIPELWAWRGTEMGLPPRIIEDSVSPRETPALLRARAFLEDDLPRGRCLILAGPTGVGKTVAAATVLRDLLFRDIWNPQNLGWFFFFPALCGALLSHDPHGSRNAMNRVLHERLAVLDDFGGEYVKPGGLLEAHIEEIVWTRHVEIRPTIITTNLTLNDLRQRLSDRVMDRLRDWAEFFPIAGPSLREASNKREGIG
jgi:DNA replication protein DnaC